MDLFLLLSLLLLSTPSFTKDAPQPILTRLSTGILLQTVNTVPYENTVPLIYSMPLPQFSKWTRGYDHHFTDPRLGPLIQTIHDLGLSTLPEFTHVPYVFKSRRYKRALDFVSDWYHFCCGFAQQKSIDKLEATEQSLSNFTDDIEAQLLSEHRNVFSSTQQYTSHFQALESALNETISTTTHELRVLARSAAAATEDLIDTKDDLYFVTTGFYQSLLQLTWSRTVDDCRQSRLPPFIVNKTRITTDLHELSLRLASHRQELSIPITTPDRYYQYPIASCLFTPTDLIVTLKVPITTIQQSIIVQSVTTLPFKFLQRICQLDLNFQYVASTSSRVIPITPELQAYCNPSSSSLCRVPRYDSPHHASHNCLHAILSNSTVASINQHCHLTCGKYLRPLIMQFTSNQFAILTNQSSLSLTCNGSSSPLQYPQHIGLLLVTLPCPCYLTMDEEIIQPNFPCGDLTRDPLLHHLVPAAFSSLQTITIANHSDFTNLDEIINHQWNMFIPHTNFSEPPLPPAVHVHTSTPIPADITYLSYGGAFAIVILGLIVFALIYRAFCIPLPLFPMAHAMTHDPLQIISTTADIAITILLVLLVLITLTILRRM